MFALVNAICWQPLTLRGGGDGAGGGDVRTRRNACVTPSTTRCGFCAQVNLHATASPSEVNVRSHRPT